jgi:hypothetical protein
MAPKPPVLCQEDEKKKADAPAQWQGAQTSHTFFLNRGPALN